MSAMQSHDNQSVTLGSFIAARREELGVSQRQLATRAGVDSSVVSRLENDLFEQPTAPLLQRIADALTIDVGELLGFIGVHPALPEPRVYFRRKLGMNADDADVLARLVEGFDSRQGKAGRS
jgi:transcriptional regulator with XRE-family HTH domain